MNTRVKNAIDKDDNINVEMDEDTSTFADSGQYATWTATNFSDSDSTPVNRNLDNDAFTDSDSTLSTLTDRMDLRDESDADGGVVSEPDSDTFSDLDVSTEEDADNETDSDIFSDTDGDADSDFDCQADNSSVTDDEYDAGPEETRTIVWRHVAFHIIRSLVQGRPKLDNSHVHYQCN
jgi:hypothetical protein